MGVGCEKRFAESVEWAEGSSKDRSRSGRQRVMSIAEGEGIYRRNVFSVSCGRNRALLREV